MRLFLTGVIDKLLWIGALFVVILAAIIIVVSSVIRKLVQKAVSQLGMLRSVPKGTQQRRDRRRKVT